MPLNLVRHNPIEVQFSQQLQHPCRRFFPFWELFFGFLVGCSSTLKCGNRHLSPALHPDSVFKDFTLGRMPILTRWYRTSTFQIVSARLSKNSASLTSASGASFFSTYFYLVSLMAQRVERLSVSVLVHDHPLMLETALVSLRTQAFFFPLVTYTSSSFNTNKPFRLLTTGPVSMFPCLASKFLNRSFWSILLFTIVFNFLINGHRYLFNESPSHTILILFWVAQTLVFLICTTLPGCHQMVSLK